MLTDFRPESPSPVSPHTLKMRFYKSPNMKVLFPYGVPVISVTPYFFHRLVLEGDREETEPSPVSFIFLLTKVGTYVTIGKNLRNGGRHEHR